MKLRVVCSLAFLIAGLVSNIHAQNEKPPKGFEKIDQEIQITTLRAQMKYDVHSFSIKPNAKIKLVFQNPDDLPHNLIICTPGKTKGKDKGKELVDAVTKLGDKGVEQNWEPTGHPRMLHSTGMVEPKKTKTIYFKAPKEEGNYPYVCTFPGHFQLMNGMMVVSRLANPITNLTYEYYLGSWNNMPDFTSLEPKKSGTLATGLFDISIRDTSENFAFVFKGVIDCPKDGEYQFVIGSDDGSQLLIDDKMVVNNDGIHGHQDKAGKVKLASGKHDIEVRFFEKSGQESLYVGWSGPGIKNQTLSRGGPKGGGGGAPKTGLPIVPPEGEATIYRNFIADAGPRAIGVGYSEGVNLAFDANNMRLAMVWTGDFIDGGRHWVGRGQGYQPPSGADVAKLPKGVAIAALDSTEDAWPKEEYRTSELRFKGYKLNKKQQPTFLYDRDNVSIEDFSLPGESSIRRTLKFKASGKAPENLYFRVATGDLTVNGDVITLEEILNINIGSKPILRNNEVLLPVNFKNGAATIELTYTWIQ